jgi:hypothetical protein
MCPVLVYVQDPGLEVCKISYLSDKGFRFVGYPNFVFPIGKQGFLNTVLSAAALACDLG